MYFTVTINHKLCPYESYINIYRGIQLKSDHLNDLLKIYIVRVCAGSKFQIPILSSNHLFNSGGGL